MSVAEWFLDLDGKKAGPYTIEQVQGLLNEGTAHSESRATSDRLGDEWVTVADLVVAFQAALNQAAPAMIQATPPQEGSSSLPLSGLPPRPKESLESAPVFTASPGNRNDATQNLFDALQSAKERKAAAKLTPAPQEEWGSQQRPQRKIPGQLWMIVALVFVLSIAIYGTAKLLGQKSGSTSASSTTATAKNTQPPPPVEPGRNPPPAMGSLAPSAPTGSLQRSVRPGSNPPSGRDATRREDEPPPPPDPRDNPQPESLPQDTPASDPANRAPPPVSETPEGVAPDAPAP